jgi:hypothetical protein
LLGTFASALAGKGLTPFVVKWVLESESFYEEGKSRIEEFSEVLQRLLEVIGGAVERAMPQAELTSNPQMDLHGAWQALQELWKTPQMQRVAWKMALEGNCDIISSMDPEIAGNLLHLHAYERLAKLEHPELNAPSLENVRRCVIQSIRKPSHRPSSGKEGERFRTAAVAAAIFRKEAGASPRDSWKWVADHLNRVDVRRPRGASFKAKTIENWSSKGTYSQHLCEGMISLANAAPFRVRTRVQVAECALSVAVHFGKALGKAATKNS